MNLIEVNNSEELASQNEKCIAQSFSSNPSSPVSISTDEIFGETILSPRLGVDYQVEIPSMLAESRHLRAFEFPSKDGLTIPIMWLHIEDKKREELKDYCRYAFVSACSSDGFNSNHLLPSSSALKAKISGSTLSRSKAYMHPTYEINACKGCSPLPESRVSQWSDDEIQSFLLGLYIFGKNLVQVRKFIECKDMRDILSFYYGKFYRSDAYSRWADCRKTRSRKCIQGQRMFTGWRQQELLSRILMGMPKEVHHSLLEAAKAYNEGRSSLEELVFSLKAAVGIAALIEGVGIGKGKQDLTGFIVDPSCRINNQSIQSLRTEIPTGKACSSLTYCDIVKFLTGDFRLSKARSNDIFWEAVWPRLLARGWHSERPRNFSSKNKNPLVFLIPGVRKFSRRKLVKGDQYFDSVTDVLNKAASDPRLFELKNEGYNSNHRNPSYLRPRFGNCNAELMKFTVVDTSLVNDAAAASLNKLRELRSLPFQAAGGHNDTEDSNSSYSSMDQQQQQHSTTDTSSSDKVSSEEVEAVACIPEKGGNIQLSDYLVAPLPLLKRQRLSACKQAMRNGYHKLLFLEKTDDCNNMKASAVEKPALFDLNQPQFPLDFDAAEQEPLHQAAEQQKLDVSEHVCGNQKSNTTDHEEASSNGSRRHSTRNRPPTIKALEALASGFLSIGRAGKDSTRMRSRSRLSVSGRTTAEAALPATAVLTATAPTIGFTYLFKEPPQINNERKEAHHLLGML